MPVITAIELDDRVATRGGAGKPNRAHRRFGAAGYKAQHFDVRHSRQHELGQSQLERGWNTEARPILHDTLERRDDRRGRMPEHERSPRKHVVDVFVVVDVPDARPSTAPDDERLATDPAEGAHRRVHASRKQLSGPPEKVVRIGSLSTRHRAHRPKLLMDPPAAMGRPRRRGTVLVVAFATRATVAAKLTS